MQWTDRAIILSIRRLGENSGVVQMLTPERGLHAGVDRAAFGKRRQGVYQQGNIVEAHWQARLTEHVGTLSCELVDPVASRLLDSRVKLAGLSSATQMIERVLSEREPQYAVYVRMMELLAAMCRDDDGEWFSDYVRLEYTLLECAGYGLDLSSCAATGQQHDLHYVSPRSGRAVSREAGLPYHDKMLGLPAFLVQEGCSEAVEHAHIMDGVRLCGYFLNERVFLPRGGVLPVARARFIEMLSQYAVLAACE